MVYVIGVCVGNYYLGSTGGLGLTGESNGFEELLQR